MVEEREVVTASLTIRDRRQLRALAGRRRVVAMEVVGYLRVPESGLHRFEGHCVSRCTLRVGNETLLDGAGSSSAAGRARVWSPAFLASLRAGRGAGVFEAVVGIVRGFWSLFPWTPMSAMRSGFCWTTTRGRRELSSALWVLQGAAWWLGVLCLVLWSGGKARRRFVVDRGPDGQPLPDGAHLALGAWLLFAVGLNLPFLLFHPGWTIIEIPLLRSVAVNGVLFLAPGLPIAGAIFGPGKPLAVLVWSLSCSFAIFVAIVTGFHFFSVSLTSVWAWNATWFLTNIGLLVHVLSARPTAR